ncbi:MAG: U32 family peptidase [Bacilli bacterium]|nr:U32 family peptidase [Bacilli bacterium]
MTQLIIIPEKKHINKIIDHCDCILIGLKDFAIGFDDYFDLTEIEELIKSNKEIFVSLNKNIHNNEIDDLKKILIKLNKLNIKGIFYYDISIVNIRKELNLNIDLVWSQEHLTTNYATINFWQSFDVKYTYLSPDITKDEIIEIRKNTTSKLIVPIFGYLPMFVSERNIVKNYLNNFKLKDESKIFSLQKQNKKYFITDENHGTTVYANNILNGYNEYIEFKKNNIEYVTLNQFYIDVDIFIEILHIYKSNEINEEQKINELLNNNVSKHFLHTETIYKVKNNG